MEELQDLIEQRNSLERQLENCQFTDEDMNNEYNRVLCKIEQLRAPNTKEELNALYGRNGLDVQSLYPACMMKGDV